MLSRTAKFFVKMEDKKSARETTNQFYIWGKIDQTNFDRDVGGRIQTGCLRDYSAWKSTN